ncbi:MAG: NUDIX domain-containing protein [Roseburia sp.]
MFPTINHAFVIVKIDEDYLLGFHKWRNDWEIFGGLIESGESLRECISRECEEELGISDVSFGGFKNRVSVGTPDASLGNEVGSC